MHRATCLGAAMAVGLALTLAPAAWSAPVSVYVSPEGNDAWSGRRAAPTADGRDGPFASLEAARDAIRVMKKAGGLPAGGVVVELAAGVYERVKPFELTADDSGTAQAPIVYRARAGAEARLVGGKVVTTFKLVTDANALKRLDAKARGRVLAADLRALGVTDFGKQDWNKKGDPGLELFYQDKPMTLARWPNTGFTPVVDVAGPVVKNRRNRDVCRIGKFIYEGDRPKRWVSEKDVWVHGYWFHDWADQRHKVESIDLAKRVISVVPPYHHYGYRKGKWFYAFNILKELDTPGEWYLDRQTGVLYFWPLSADLAAGRPMVSVAPTLIEMTGVSHVRVHGLVLEAARADAVRASKVEHVEVSACTIRNCGSWAVRVSGTRSGVVGCDITETGRGGVALTGGDRKTLAPGGLYALNNHIHHYSRWKRMYQPAVAVRGVGNRMANNLIHNAPHEAVAFSGNDHVIELNEIHSVCYESNDAGAIYSGRNWSWRGTVIRHNYMHHVSGFRGRGCVGVYFDDILSGNHIVGNIFYKVTRAAFIGGGRDCVVANNIFVDCKPALHVDARGMGKYDYGASTLQPKRLLASPYKTPIWRKHYPRLVGMLDDEPEKPKHNRIARNIWWGGRWDEVHKHARPLLILENNLLDADPRFVDAARQDFRLKADSPAWKLGFERIPVEKIGLYKDAKRASWPVKHEVRPTDAPPARRNPPTHTAAGVRPGTVRVDGKVGPGEWGMNAKAAMVCAQAACGQPSKRRTRAWAAFDGQDLFLLAITDVDPAKALHPEAGWGRSDAVEIAFRDPAQKRSATFNLRGFPNGRCESVCDAGAPAAAAAKLGKAVQFAASADKGRWIAEWRIPLAAAAVNPKRAKKLAFNLNVRRMADQTWMVWARTGAAIWDVDSAGVIVLRK